mmetsp:Transcript_4784/g.15360  ORF Transcript_4784/g.15360 Transcript_4784/m.15360 type:complete len:137 (-) Transcript_4784:31-441(-)
MGSRTADLRYNQSASGKRVPPEALHLVLACGADQSSSRCSVRQSQSNPVTVCRYHVQDNVTIFVATGARSVCTIFTCISSPSGSVRIFSEQVDFLHTGEFVKVEPVHLLSLALSPFARCGSAVSRGRGGLARRLKR